VLLHMTTAVSHHFTLLEALLIEGRARVLLPLHAVL
jgi:hypothetical protein